MNNLSIPISLLSGSTETAWWDHLSPDSADDNSFGMHETRDAREFVEQKNCRMVVGNFQIPKSIGPVVCC